MAHRPPGTTSPLDAPLMPDPVIEAFKKDVDRTLIRAQLRRSVDERVQAMIGALRFAEGLRQGARGSSER